MDTTVTKINPLGTERIGADFSSPSPSFRLKYAAAPSPISRLKAMAITVIGITTLVALEKRLAVQSAHILFTDKF